MPTKRLRDSDLFIVCPIDPSLIWRDTLYDGFLCESVGFLVQTVDINGIMR